uniref:Uncharacterized protein n=1 Tax=Trypanosoma congolense (strain IL3000) TaxID=1068625 RepID=G0UN13_TRYCI|nr:hypothetical protein, unlikely [Trypanosoma congolense IL3000]
MIREQFPRPEEVPSWRPGTPPITRASKRGKAPTPVVETRDEANALPQAEPCNPNPQVPAGSVDTNRNTLVPVNDYLHGRRGRPRYHRHLAACPPKWAPGCMRSQLDETMRNHFHRKQVAFIESRSMLAEVSRRGAPTTTALRH